MFAENLKPEIWETADSTQAETTHLSESIISGNGEKVISVDRFSDGTVFVSFWGRMPGVTIDIMECWQTKNGGVIEVKGFLGKIEALKDGGFFPGVVERRYDAFNKGFGVDSASPKPPVNIEQWLPSLEELPERIDVQASIKQILAWVSEMAELEEQNQLPEDFSLPELVALP